MEEFKQVSRKYSRALRPAPKDTSASGEPELESIDSMTKWLAVAFVGSVIAVVVWFANHPELIYPSSR